MGKINKVYYEELDPNVIDLPTAGEFYYLFNLVGFDERFHADFERSEIDQINIRNSILGDRKRNGVIDGKLQTASSLLAVSSLKNKVIIVADIE